MFCVKCGKETAGSNRFCTKCFLEENTLFEIQNFKLTVCGCGSYFDRKWKKGDDIEKVVKNQILEKIKTRNKIIDTKIMLKKIGNGYKATIQCLGIIPPYKEPKKEEKIIDIRIDEIKCETCKKISGGYYVAVIQVRGRRKDNILNNIMTIVDKSSITNIQSIENGYDIKFMNKSSASNVIKKMNNKNVKRSYKFVTTKDGKKLYRNYYSIR